MSWEIRQGDALVRLREMPDESVQTCITSPPYWGLRNYGDDAQLGLEETPEKYVESIVAAFQEVRRVLRPDGTLWLNLGDTFSGGRNGKPGPQSDVRHPGRTRGWVPPQAAGGSGLAFKQLVGVPWRVAFALQADGWWLRSDIIWAKSNPMPESVADRPSRSHEYLFLLAKSERYYYDAEAIREPDLGTDHPRNVLDRPEPSGGLLPSHNGIRRAGGRSGMGRNKRSVWTVPTRPFPAAHFATFPPKLIEPCVLAGSPIDGVVLDPFAGAGTTGVVALRHGRRFIGIELNSDYCELARERIRNDGPLFNVASEVAA